MGTRERIIRDLLGLATLLPSLQIGEWTGWVGGLAASYLILTGLFAH